MGAGIEGKVRHDTGYVRRLNRPEDQPREEQVRRLRQRIITGLLEPCAAMSGTHGSQGR